MRVIIIGANGQLGNDLVSHLSGAYDVISLTHDNLEITDSAQVKMVIKKYSPGVLINTAAYHNLNECEENPSKAFLVNAVGVKNLADASKEKNIRLVHISTDYVFDGAKNTPYFEDDVALPASVYGISKLAGEFFAKRAGNYMVIRVASLFGVTGCRAKKGKNFVENMLELSKTKDSIEVSRNVYSSPTYTRDASLIIGKLLANNAASGVYHLTNGGGCSWHEFACEIFSQSGIDIEVKERYEDGDSTFRPLYTVMQSKKIPELRSWKDALADYLKERRTKNDRGC